MWWDTQADNAGPELAALRVWSPAADWARATAAGVGSVRCAVCLITDWTGAPWSLSRSAATPDLYTAGTDAMLNALSNNTVGMKDETTSPLDPENMTVHSSVQWRVAGGRAQPACGHTVWRRPRVVKKGALSCLSSLINYTRRDLGLSHSVTEEDASKLWLWKGQEPFQCPLTCFKY